ncbi:MAG: hypothetical protein JWO50_576 [Candidatus Kaiserbacteria bacterium]|nr:hypothetical protein [Candidatus Kaiserbacteria bacterium]
MSKILSFLNLIGAFLIFLVYIAIALTLLLFIPTLLFGGGVWFYTDYLAPLLKYVDYIAALLSIIFLFLCIFRKYRIFAGSALVYCSYAIGVDLWFQSLINTYISFGPVGTILGVFFLGVGVFFTGLVALLWAHLFTAFWSLLGSGLYMIGIRWFGLYIAQNETDSQYDPNLDEPDEDGITERMIQKMISKNGSNKNVIEDISTEYIEPRQEIVKFDAEEYLSLLKITETFINRGRSDDPPRFVIFMGGVGSGKTTSRRVNFSINYVNFDFGEIHLSLEKAFGVKFPRISEYASYVSDLVLRQALQERKKIVIEIIGDSYALISPVINAMKGIGYDVSIEGIIDDTVASYGRYMYAVDKDPDYISAADTQELTLSFFHHYFGLVPAP